MFCFNTFIFNKYRVTFYLKNESEEAEGTGLTFKILNSKFSFSFIYKGNILGVWIDYENGKMYKNSPIKGSYSALNCYYLTFIDEEFAQSQYEKLKVLFWKDSFLSGLKEYWNIKCYIGIDIDAGPILFELSPSGTAFLTGSSTFFGDFEVRKDILKTAETAAHTVKFGDKRHYLLADIALVGESIMLAMRTHAKH